MIKFYITVVALPRDVAFCNFLQDSASVLAGVLTFGIAAIAQIRDKFWKQICELFFFDLAVHFRF